METRRALSLTTEDFASAITTTGADDTASEYITITTEKGYQRMTGVTRDLPSGFDYYLRGRIHKQTGERLHQVYVKWEHGGDWFQPQQAVFGKPFQISEITVVNREKECETECYYTEEFVFDIPEAALRKVYERGVLKVDVPEHEALPKKFLDNNRDKLGLTYRILTEIGFHPAALILSQEIISYLDTVDRLAQITQQEAPSI